MSRFVASTLGFIAAAALWLPVASGDDAVELHLQKLATYDQTLPFQEAFKECGLAANIPRDVMTAAAKHFSSILLVDDAAAVKTGLAAAIRVTGLEAPGGGGWTGEKMLAVEMTLYRDGKPVGKFRNSRRSKGHSVGLLKAGNCSILNSNAEALSRQITSWLDGQIWSLGLKN
jgi:hypothetical protein